MTENLTLVEKPEIRKEYVNQDNDKKRIFDLDCECESRFLYSSPCLMAQIEEDEDFLKG